MTQARLADGRILNFPDGTDPAIIQQTVKRILSEQPQAPQVTPQATPAPGAAGDVFLDTEERRQQGAVDPIQSPEAPATPEQPQQRRPSALGQRAQGLSNLISQASDFLTSAEQRTPELEALGEIGAAPELNDLTSLNSLVTSAALLTATSQQSIKGILDKHLDPSIPRTFREDAKGNLIVEVPSGSYALNKPGFSIQDIPEFAFQALAFSPAGKAAKGLGAVSKIGQVAGQSAATAAVLEGTESALGGEEFSGVDVALAGLTGGAGKAAEELLGAGFRAIKGKIAPEQQAILDEAKRLNIPILGSDIRQPATAAGKIARSTGEKDFFLGPGSARANQQAARIKATQELAEQNQLFSFGAVVDDLRFSKEAEKSALGDVFFRVGETLDAVGEIPIPTTRANLAQVQSILDRPGIIQSENLQKNLQTLAGNLDFPQTYTSIRKNRDAWTKILETIDNQGRTQLSSDEDRLFKNIRAGMTRDMKTFETANLSPADKRTINRTNAAFERHTETFGKTKLKTILDKGDVTPEIVRNSLFTTNRSDVQRLADNLTPTGRNNAKAAFIGDTIDQLAKKGAGLTPNTFQSAIQKFPDTVDVLFKGPDRRQLDGLMKVLQTTRQAQDAAIATPTGQQVIGFGVAQSVTSNPVQALLTLGSIGGISRIYESAPVRNALLRMASIPRGSTKFEAAADAARQAITAGIQAVTAQESTPTQLAAPAPIQAAQQ